MIELPRQAPAVRRLLPVLWGRGAPRAYPAAGRRLTHEVPESQGNLPRAPKPRSWMPGNAALKSLAGSPLAGRFHAWHGASGQRYVCSVFRLDPAAPDAGLPQFAGAIVLAVVRAGDHRRLVSLWQGQSHADPRNFIIEALAGGAGEWHVHLPPNTAAHRRAIIADIEAARRANSAACGRPPLKAAP